MDEETIRVVAEATGEVAKTGGKVVDLTVGAGRFFDRVMGDIVEDGVGLVRDRLRFYRQERSEILAFEMEKRLLERGIGNPRAVPPKVALPLIEAASIEDEPTLSKLWVELLASAMDPSKPRVEKKFVSILQELSGEDARVLADVYKEWKDIEPRETPFMDSGIEYGDGVGGMHENNQVSIVTLYRLGLIGPAEMSFAVPIAAEAAFGGPVKLYGQKITVVGNLDAVTITPLGAAFCAAVGM